MLPDGFGPDAVKRMELVLEGQEFKTNRVDTHLDHTEFSRRSKGEVDDAVGKEAAVGDGDDDGALIAQISDLNLTAEGQSVMGGGEFVHVEGAAAGGGTALEERAVPAGQSALDTDEASEDGGAGGRNGVDDLGRADVMRHRNHRSCVRRSRGCRGGRLCRESRHDDQGREGESGLGPSR
jgi:hypothetical protein